MKHASFAAYLGVLLLAGLSAPAEANPANVVPPTRILLVDRNEVLSHSAVGQSIMSQVKVLVLSAQGGLKARDAALQNEGRALQQQLAILSPAVKAAKIKAFDEQRTALQEDLQKQQNLIQGGLLVARTQAMNALKPILQKIMIERGGTLLLDRNAAMEWLPAYDITPLAITRLNQTVTQIKVTPTPMPEGAAPQQ